MREPRPARVRGQPGFWAFLVHRFSGLALALFLPVHFHVLSLALRDPAAFDGFVRWTEAPAVRLAEAGLIALLALHLSGGLRILAVEFLPWRDWQKTALALSAGLSLAVGAAFLIVAG